MTLRTAFFWLHLTAGIVAGAIVLLMSVTGVALTYERQMIAWSDREFKSSPQPGMERMPVERLVQEFRRQNPGQEPTAVTVEAGPTRTGGRQRRRSAPSTSTRTRGACSGTANQGMRQAMSKLRAWHRWLAIEGAGRPAARAITGWANVLFLFIVASGLYMWFPRRWTWQTVRAVLLFRPALRGKARDFNWHNVIGIWSSVPLLIVVASAVPISFPWGNALVYRMVGEEPPAHAAAAAAPRLARRAGGAGAARRRPAPSVDGLSPLLAQAERQEPDWRTINLRLPSAPRRAGGVRHRSRRRRPTPPAVHVDPHARGSGRRPTNRSTP